ncbi:MAG: L-rhamnose isomerase [Spirochaetes bacterium]|jgi:L-rhamnose isomerase|nr:L-rhamnose isomerase [Spirochaetota bacterium]
MKRDNVKQSYDIAKERYAELGVDTDAVLKKLADVPISIHCWQGEDVLGFEGVETVSGGIMATGNYPGRARTPDELRRDFEKAHSLVPGTHRFNLHAMHRDTTEKVDRDEIAPKHFQSWVDWAKELRLGVDFNTTFFSHEKFDKGFSLAHPDKAIRDFWIEHGKRCREISAYMGRELGTASMDNHWLPDGWKDLPADRLGPRERLIDSLDKMLEKKYPETETIDAVESKLFGLGAEAYTVGSHEFYIAYAMSRGTALTMDAGHYHPTESIAEKLSALLPFIPRIMLHVSRPVRWDSDHVVLFDDETKAIMREIARAEAWDRVAVGLDFFDASINRITAWVTGVRAAMKSALVALLEPIDLIRKAEEANNLGDRLALQEEAKSLPFGAVWDQFCLQNDVPVGTDWLDDVKQYEKDVLFKRG